MLNECARFIRYICKFFFVVVAVVVSQLVLPLANAFYSSFRIYFPLSFPCAYSFFHGINFIFTGAEVFPAIFRLQDQAETCIIPLYYRVEWSARVGLTICILHILKEAKHKFIHSGKLESR